MEVAALMQYAACNIRPDFCCWVTTLDPALKLSNEVIIN